jgi:ring-1,2-phenylacetyl-CoA epoxidase subunit PaaC
VTHDVDPSGALDNAYGGLVEADSDARWAFGTGFDDPLAGVDVATPPGVDGPSLAAYSVMLADDALVMAQRLTEWCTRAPELEEEVALANIGLDLLGQTRLLLARAAAANPAAVPRLPDGSPVPPDDRLAFFRDPDAFRCVWLVELPNGDFATTVVRLVVFATWRLALLERLRGSVDPVLAAVAEKGVKEVRYHRDYAARWLLTLAGGTDVSRGRTVAALAAVWPYTAELGREQELVTELVDAGVAAEPHAVWSETVAWLRELLATAGLAEPQVVPLPGPEGRGGRDGVHTAWLPPLLEEMQSVARAHPEGRW